MFEVAAVAMEVKSMQSQSSQSLFRQAESQPRHSVRSLSSAMVVTALYGLLNVMPWSQAIAQTTGSENRSETERTELATGQIIPYACYDRAGNVVYTTINPQETLGWEMGCREVQYESTFREAPPITYFQCFDVNGGVAFNTIDAAVAEESELFCREIGARVTTPVPYRPVYYECYNADGTLAFATSYPQNTFGWKPGCRELQYQDAMLTQMPDRTPYECFDISGNVAFVTYDPLEVRRWKLGCREIRPN
ncbi:MAG: hypothetical protein MUF72_08480 [Elainella sp. Prado103]|jgi:hypothetical protein|nr:hypothetical protein [Elainella sp. Prado103]